MTQKDTHILQEDEERGEGEEDEMEEEKEEERKKKKANMRKKSAPPCPLVLAGGATRSGLTEVSCLGFKVFDISYMPNILRISGMTGLFNL